MKDLHSQGMSSEDPICGYRVDEQVEIYQQHINTVRPGILDGAKGHSLSVLKSRLANGKEDSMNKTYCDSDDDLEIVYDDEDQTAQFQLPVEGQDSEHKSFDSEDETMDSEFGSDEWVDEEEFSIITKDQEEQQDIIEEIKDLEDAVPELVDNYRLIDRLGTGTFSSVYKAIVCTPPLNPQGTVAAHLFYLNTQIKLYARQKSVCCYQTHLCDKQSRTDSKRNLYSAGLRRVSECFTAYHSFQKS